MSEVSRHHGLWERRDYLDHEWYRQARSTLIVPMRHIGHMGLHRAVEPPPRPTLEMTADYLDAYDIAHPKPGIESFEFAAEYFADSYIHYTCVPDKQELMLGIANNIMRQLPWIKGNHE